MIPTLIILAAVGTVGSVFLFGSLILSGRADDASEKFLGDFPNLPSGIFHTTTDGEGAQYDPDA